MLILLSYCLFLIGSLFLALVLSIGLSKIELI